MHAFLVVLGVVGLASIGFVLFMLIALQCQSLPKAKEFLDHYED